MKTITRQKDRGELEGLLRGLDRLFILGCGTCATMCRTGGREQVLEMADWLRGQHRIVTGWTVVPTACDEMTWEFLKQHRQAVEAAQALLVMACAFGVQTAAAWSGKLVVPALDTLFIGKEEGLGRYTEVCRQCGHCVLGDTGGICPITACHKGILNGPCGGMKDGKCEVDPNRDCAWVLIWRRLEQLGRLELFRKYHPPKDHQAVVRPGQVTVELT